MREICMSGSMSGMWKRSMVRLVRHRQTKGADTDRPDLNHRATSRLYRLTGTYIGGHHSTITLYLFPNEYGAGVSLLTMAVRADSVGAYGTMIISPR